MSPRPAFTDKNILVTGAGGYIGSALVKAIAAGAPQSLTLLDLSEHNLVELKRVLDADFPSVSYQAVAGSVNDSTLVGSLFAESRKHLIFHAAAFKHVELMELNPFAALMNNAVGTFVLARAAVAHGCDSLVLVSTDKAVRPHSMMGASKRLAELITISLSRPDSPMNAVRLCNISGSSGSVIPLFLGQIARGKALTITDPDATRSFMSVDQAVTAILDAAACRANGCILMPRFPEPVRIADLAKSLVNGHGPYPIEIVGLRPGEKVSEDFIGPNETENETVRGSLIALETTKLPPAECDQLMQRLRTYIGYRNLPAVLDLLKCTVPEYVPSELIMRGASVSAKQ
jgi:FlaA1/EpsC-like NDP-sugar epimerase